MSRSDDTSCVAGSRPQQITERTRYLHRGTSLARCERVHAALLLLASSLLARGAAAQDVLPPPPPAETSYELESPHRSRGPWSDPVLAEIAEQSDADEPERDEHPPSFEATGYFEIGGSNRGFAAGVGAQLDVWPSPDVGLGARIGAIGTGPFLGSGDEADGMRAEAIASVRLGSSAFALVPSVGVGAGWITERHHESCFISFGECTPTTTHLRSGAHVLVPVGAGLHFRFRRFTFYADWRTTHIHEVTIVHTVAAAFGGNW